MNKVKAWYTFAHRVWVALSLGWIALIISLIPFALIRLDRAGALLVCAAIVAEVLHDKRYRSFISQIQPGVTTRYRYLEVDVHGKDRKDIKVTADQANIGPVTVNTESWPLYHLVNKDEFFPYEETRMWDIERTMKRVDSRVDYAIVISVLVGTIFWAYG